MKRPTNDLNRRGLIKVAKVAAATVLLAPVTGVWVERMEESFEVVSSDVLSADASVYDRTAGMCALDLVVDVVAPERVVIENELPVGNNRTVRATGERSLRAVVPADSTVLIYAVNLDTKESEALKTYHISEKCELQEAER